MKILSEKITSLPVSATLAMAAKARELKAKGIDVPYMVKDDEGHGFYNEENQFDFYKSMGKFLDKYLK